MKLARALTTGLLVTAPFVACDKDPVGTNVDPHLTIAAESVTVNLFASASVRTMVVHNTLDAPQYVSRDQNVATVDALGAVTGVAVGSTYVVDCVVYRGT
jgi:Big-like domain-containing protein